MDPLPGTETPTAIIRFFQIIHVMLVCMPLLGITILTAVNVNRRLSEKNRKQRIMRWIYRHLPEGTPTQ